LIWILITLALYHLGQWQSSPQPPYPRPQAYRLKKGTGRKPLFGEQAKRYPVGLYD